MLRPGTPSSSDDRSYDNYGKFYDEHTISVISGFASKEQIQKAIIVGINKYNIEYRDSLRSEIHVNAINNRYGLPTGVTFLWVSNPELYHLLLGRNADGTERVEQVLDDDLDFSDLKDWSDMVEEENEHSHIEILPSLIEIPEIQLSPSQVRMGINKTGNEVFDDTVRLSISPAYVMDINEGEIHNQLFCANSPSWLSAKQLTQIFTHFIPPERRKDGYPKVTLKEPFKKKGKVRKMATVKFDPSKKDAQFALHMTKKLTIKNTRGKDAVLFFTMAKKRTSK